MSPKLRIKSILLFYKDRLEIENCLLDAIFKQKFRNLIEKYVPKVYISACYKNLTFRTLGVGHL